VWRQQEIAQQSDRLYLTQTSPADPSGSKRSSCRGSGTMDSWRWS